MRPVAPGSEEGQPTGAMRHLRHLDRSERKRPSKRAGSGHRTYVLHERSSTPGGHYSRAWLPGSPIVTQVGGGLACSPPCTLEQDVEIEHYIAFQHRIDSPGQLMCQDRQGLPLAVCFLSAAQILLARRIVAEEQDRRFGEGPRERRSADLRAGGALPLPR